jgi:N-acetylmuramic acid 6-phosphate etherase
MSLPPDRGHLATELPPRDAPALDTLTTNDCIAMLAADQHAAVRAVEQVATDIAALVDAIAPRIAAGGRLIYLGCGTSGRLGVLDAAECPPTFQAEAGTIIGLIAGGDASLRRSSEAAEDDPDGAAPLLASLDLSERDTVLGIASGGTTPWVLGGVTLARKRGACTALLTCVPCDTEVDHAIVLATGPELLVGSTRLKAGTATKIALNSITTTLFTRLGKVYGNLMVDLRATNDKLRDRALRIVASCGGLDRAAAAEVLAEAGGDVKTAIVMHTLGLCVQDASRRLAEAEGHLREVLR